MKTERTDPKNITAAVEHWKREIADTRQQIDSGRNEPLYRIDIWNAYIMECQDKVKRLIAGTPAARQKQITDKRPKTED